MRLQLVLATKGVQFFCPGLKRHITNIQLSGKLRCSGNRKLRIDGIARFKVNEPFSAARARKPDAQFAWKWTQTHSPVRLSRSGTRRWPSTLAALSALCE